MSKASISIIIPVYNHAELLAKALAALAAQDVAPFEILVIDDASSDNSAELAERSFALFDGKCRFRVLRNERNLGVNATLNRGLAEITGDYVICTAADDWLLPACVGEMTHTLERYPQARLVTSQYVEYFEADDRFVEHDKASEYGLWYCEGDEPRYFDSMRVREILRHGHVAWPVSASMMHVGSLRGAGGFDTDLKWHADWFASMSLALRSGFCAVSKPLAVFRVAAASYSGGNVRNVFAQRDVCEAILCKLAEPQNIELRSALTRRPSPFAPFIRHMLPAAWRMRQWDMLAAMAQWWIGEMARGRRPGGLRKLALRAGLYRPPRLP